MALPSCSLPAPLGGDIDAALSAKLPDDVQVLARGRLKIFKCNPPAREPLLFDDLEALMG